MRGIGVMPTPGLRPIALKMSKTAFAEICFIFVKFRWNEGFVRSAYFIDIPWFFLAFSWTMKYFTSRVKWFRLFFSSFYFTLWIVKQNLSTNSIKVLKFSMRDLESKLEFWKTELFSSHCQTAPLYRPEKSTQFGGRCSLAVATVYWKFAFRIELVVYRENFAI